MRRKELMILASSGNPELQGQLLRSMEGGRRLKIAAVTTVVVAAALAAASRSEAVRSTEAYATMCSGLKPHPFLVGDYNELIDCQPRVCAKSVMQLRTATGIKNSEIEVCVDPADGQSGIAPLPIEFGDELITTDVMLLQATATSKTREGTISTNAAAIFSGVQDMAGQSEAGRMACYAFQDALFGAVEDAPQFKRRINDVNLTSLDLLTKEQLTDPNTMTLPVLITAESQGFGGMLSSSDKVEQISGISGFSNDIKPLSCATPDNSEVL